MLLQGQPNQVVQKRVKKGGKYKIVALFRFDENGNADIEESKYSATDLSKLNHLFGKKTIVDQELMDDEIRDMAKEQGIKSWHTKSIKRLKEEMGV